MEVEAERRRPSLYPGALCVRDGRVLFGRLSGSQTMTTSHWASSLSAVSSAAYSSTTPTAMWAALLRTCRRDQTCAGDLGADRRRGEVLGRGRLCSPTRITSSGRAACKRFLGSEAQDGRYGEGGGTAPTDPPPARSCRRLLLEASYQRERRRLAAERKAAFCDPPLGWWPPWRAAASTDRDDPVVLMRFVGRWTSRRSRVMRLMIIVQGRWVSLAGERVCCEHHKTTGKQRRL